MIELRLLGAPALERDDGAPLRGRAAQRHRIALLALLALAPAQRLSRDKLLAYLWPESDPERARNLLNVAVYVLRSAIGDGAILSDGDDLRLDAEAVRVDVLELEAAIGRSDHARAVELYRGPFLDGFFLSDAPEFEQWGAGERERLATRYATALEAIAEAAERERDFAKAAEWWKKRAAQDPYDSRVALRLMLALEASGNRAGALQYASVHQRLLQNEFGAEPAPDVAALAERLRTEPAVAPVAVPSSAAEREPVLSGSAAESVDVPHPIVLPDAGIRPETPRRGPSRRRTISRAIALVGVASLLGAAWAAWPRAHEPEPSIVVLPFLDLSPDGDNEYFSDGLTEEIITRLAAIPDLKVISRTSAMHYKGSTEALRKIAGELQVAHVLEGSVRQSGDSVRISAQLIDAETDEHLWAENYDHELRDIFRAQEEIAQEVARALEVKLGAQTRRLLVRQGTRDPEAHLLYRRGRFVWNLRTKEGHEQALAYFDQAIARDSGYADAYAGMADVYLTAYQFNVWGWPEAEAYSRLKWAAERALALDDESADAHTSFASALWWQKNWPGTERELRRAIELNPGHATARTWYSLLLSGLGRPEEALRESRRAYELDPFSVIVSITYAWQCYLTRDYDRAIAQYGLTLEISPSWGPAYAQLGLSYAQKGMSEEAIRAVRKAVELSPDSMGFLADLAYVQGLAGRTEEARSNLRLAKGRPVEGFSIARAFVALSEPDSAFAWLGRSTWKWPHRAVKSDPALDPLRSDPRFTALVARVDREMGIQ